MQAIALGQTTPYFQCQKAVISSFKTFYPPVSLLGIPLEIREQIWQAVSEDIRQNPDTEWFKRPQTGYDGLSLVCRQIWHEISRFWRRAIVPPNRLSCFLEQPYSRSGLAELRSISMGIPFNMSPTFYSHLSVMFRYLNPLLQDLRLFFSGADTHGMRAFVHGCVNDTLKRQIPSSRFPVNIEAFESRIPLIHTIGRLENLQTLVLWNFNIPFLQSHLIKGKPKLSRLCVVLDPRTSLHWPYDANNSGMFLTPVIENLSPVKELHISTNAVLSAIQLTSKVASTLEHLTWIMPDMSRETHSIYTNLFPNSGVVLYNLRWHAKNLHTLRMCIESVFYEGVDAHLHFVQEFQAHVPFFHQLKKLDLHVCSESPWIGPELLQALPPTLERLYISDKLINIEAFIELLNGIFLRAEDPLPGHLKWLHGNPENMAKLGFIGYEYTPNEDPVVASLQKMVILKLNGLLLDRELNRHLVFESHGSTELLSSSGTFDLRGRSDTALTDNDKKMQSNKFFIGTEKRSKKASRNICKSLSNNFYFGLETEAEMIFHHEKAAKACELPIRRYPTEIDAEDADHWSCQ